VQKKVKIVLAIFLPAVLTLHSTNDQIGDTQVNVALNPTLQIVKFCGVPAPVDGDNQD
jgi:hypothetical protein